MVIKNLDAFGIKKYNKSDASFLINICYYKNTSSSIYNLVLYWAGNNILSGAYLIQSGINLQCIPTPSCIQSKCTIATYENNKYKKIT